MLTVYRPCEKCGMYFFSKYKSLKEFLRKRKNGDYIKCCSSRCSHSRERNWEIRKTVSDKLRKDRYCVICGGLIDRCKTKSRKFCCDECKRISRKQSYEKYWTDEHRKEFVEHGKLIASKLQKRSKNEILFFDMCKEYFDKRGISVGHNEPIFNGWDADILIYDFRIAVHWNGVIHYKEIFKCGNTLRRIESRDRIKYDVIEGMGWSNYVIKDMGKCDPKFVKCEFEKFLKIHNYFISN